MHPESKRQLVATVIGLWLAAPGSSHASEGKGARLGDKVAVTLSESSAIEARETRLVGTLSEFDSDTISILRSKRHPVRIPRAQIVRLEVGGNTRDRNAGRGAIIGALFGFAWAAVEHSRCKGQVFCGLEFGLPLLTTPVGAIVGLTTGTRTWTDVPLPASGGALAPTRRGYQVAVSIRF
jgi:hypothetical protein